LEGKHKETRKKAEEMLKKKRRKVASKSRVQGTKALVEEAADKK
jgi:hypothetical protein